MTKFITQEINTLPVSLYVYTNALKKGMNQTLPSIEKSTGIKSNFYLNIEAVNVMCIERRYISTQDKVSHFIIQQIFEESQRIQQSNNTKISFNKLASCCNSDPWWYWCFYEERVKYSNKQFHS